MSEQEYLKRVETENYPTVWSAFSDDMCGIDSLTNAGVTELYLTIRGLNGASNSISRYESGNSFSDVLASVLIPLTDPKQRCDNIKFYPQFILE